MIISINKKYADSHSNSILSDQCSAIIRSHHFIVCDSDTYKKIVDAVEKNGSTTQKELFKAYRGFQPTEEQVKYLTTIDLDKLNITDNSFHGLIELPTEVLAENGMNEWNTYKTLSETYKHDRTYKNIFSLITKAINHNEVVSGHAGGWSSFVNYINHKNANEYIGMYKYKVFVIFDRDTNDNESFDGNKNGLFSFLCGKKANQITDGDIYTLSQTGYIWHCWYKRAIENYIPNHIYEDQRVDVSSIPSTYPERDYFNFTRFEKEHHGYNKDMMKDFSAKMSKSDYEEHIKTFFIDGKDVSEMQLLLLKIAKVI